MATKPGWESLIQAKLRDRASQIPREWVLPQGILDQAHEDSNLNAFNVIKECKLLTVEETRLTEAFTAQELHNELVERRVTAVDVCKAFCKRAAIAQQLTNCATEVFFQDALERARFLDEYLAKNNKPYGPFHGVPISIKDSFNLQGKASTIGFVAYLAKPSAERNSPLVDILLENGAILYLKTNVPQTMLTMDSTNNIFGRTLNPHCLRLNAGGSSGGEGALIALRGSILGVGTDIGGSIRVPALCNGIYGFKPTTHRIPDGGQQVSGRVGTPGLHSAAGPLAQSASDLTFFCRTVLSTQPEPWRRDATAHATGWREVPRKKGLSIGVWMGDPDFPLTRSVHDALQMAKNALEKAGHGVRLVTTFPSLQTCLQLAARHFLLDTQNTPLQILQEGDEQPIKALEYASPAALAPPEQWPSTLDDLWAMNASHGKLVEEIATEVWRPHQLDVLICPGHRKTATLHDTYGAPAYTVLWNLLDFPASIIPLPHSPGATSVKIPPPNGAPPEIIEGAPTAIQVVGWKFQDEEVLMATEVIDEALRRYIPDGDPNASHLRATL